MAIMIGWPYIPNKRQPSARLTAGCQHGGGQAKEQETDGKAAAMGIVMTYKMACVCCGSDVYYPWHAANIGGVIRVRCPTCGASYEVTANGG